MAALDKMLRESLKLPSRGCCRFSSRPRGLVWQGGTVLRLCMRVHDTNRMDYAAAAVGRVPKSRAANNRPNFMQLEKFPSLAIIHFMEALGSKYISDLNIHHNYSAAPRDTKNIGTSI